MQDNIFKVNRTLYAVLICVISAVFLWWLTGRFGMEGASTVLVLIAFMIVASVYEHRYLQRKINLSEQRFRTLVENSLDMIVLIDATGRISYSSSSTQQILGYKKEEWEGRNIVEFIHEDDRAMVLTQLERTLKSSGEAIYTVARVRHKNTIYRWMEATGRNLLEDKNIRAIVINCRDVSARKLAEEVLRRDKQALERMVDERSKALVKAQEELKATGRLADIGTLAAIVAHELRTPLGVIHMAVHNLKNKHAQLADNSHLQNIEKKVWEGNRIIDNLLNYSRIKPPQYQACRLRGLIEECLIAIEHLLLQFKVEVIRDLKVAEDFVLEADTDQMREILMNILLNAVQSFALAPHRLTISVDLPEEGKVEIRIKDNGRGIPQEDMDKIFRPFYTTKAKGTGLGLSICNELVNLHGGRIDVISELQEGTEIIITLPLRRPLAVPAKK